MANRTVRDAHTIHGTNPQNLIEKIIRTRVYESRYWKEDCFALNCELLVDKACELKYVGGLIGETMNPSPFLCLLQKMLQIQPEKEIIIEFIKRNEFKYARALGAMYLRLTGESVEIFKYLETLYNDYSKLRRQEKDGVIAVLRMDEFIDELLREDRVCSIVLPRLQKRQVLEDQNLLDPRISILDEDLQEAMLQAFEQDKQQQEEAEAAARREEERRLEKERLTNGDITENGRSRRRDDNARSRSRSRSRSRGRKRSPRRDRHHNYHQTKRENRRDRSRERDRGRRDRDRAVSPSPEVIKSSRRDHRDRDYGDRDKDRKRDSPDRRKDRRDRERGSVGSDDNRESRRKRDKDHDRHKDKH